MKRLLGMFFVFSLIFLVSSAIAGNFDYQEDRNVETDELVGEVVDILEDIEILNGWIFLLQEEFVRKMEKYEEKTGMSPEKLYEYFWMSLDGINAFIGSAIDEIEGEPETITYARVVEARSDIEIAFAAVGILYEIINKMDFDNLEEKFLVFQQRFLLILSS